MTNRQKYPNTEEACKAYQEDHDTYHDNMLNWLDDEYKAPAPKLPAWVTAGVLYTANRDPDAVYKIFEVDYARESIIWGRPTGREAISSMPFDTFLNSDGGRVEYKASAPKLPDWLKPGAKFTFTWGGQEPRLHQFKKDLPERLRFRSVTNFNKSEIESSFSYEFFFKNLERFKPVKDGLVAPEWLKPGVWTHSIRFPGIVRHTKSVDLCDDLLIIKTTDDRGDGWLRSQSTIDSTLKQAKIIPWTAKQALEFLESGKKLGLPSLPFVKPEYLKVLSDGRAYMVLSSLESYDLRQLAEQFETEDHLPCGSW